MKKTAKKVTVDIGAVIPPGPKGGKYQINCTKDNGRKVYFHSSRQDFRAGQRVTLTYHICRRDGELVGARFSAWEDAKILQADEVQVRKRKKRGVKYDDPDTAQRIRDLQKTLNTFRSRMHKKKGHTFIEGHRVEIEERKWFRIPLEDGRTVHFPWAKDCARFIVDYSEGGEDE